MTLSLLALLTSLSFGEFGYHVAQNEQRLVDLAALLQLGAFRAGGALAFRSRKVDKIERGDTDSAVSGLAALFAKVRLDCDAEDRVAAAGRFVHARFARVTVGVSKGDEVQHGLCAHDNLFFAVGNKNTATNSLANLKIFV